MKKAHILIVFIGLISFTINAQSIVVNDSAQYGFNRPRIVLIGDTMPYIFFGKAGASSNVYGSKLVNGAFTQPVQVVPDSMSPRVGTTDGPNVVILNDTIYLAWLNISSANHHVFVSRSTDFGDSFDVPIRADSVFNGDNLEYPGIAIGPNGDIGVYYIRSTSTWTMPRQALVKSYDRGQSFGSEVIVDSFSPGATCECCQGQLAINGNDWVYYFRNNDNDIRNNYTLHSSDGGQSFPNTYEMDSLDWYIQSCPTSGPEGYINGNKSFSTWMTRGSGSMRILYGSVDLGTGTITKGQFIDNSIPSGNTQNHPTLDGRGDTVAIVWHDNRYLFTHVFARVSIDGGQTFGTTHLISDTTVNGTFNMGDVAFANGVFHFTWRSANVVMYKAMNYNQLVGVEQWDESKNKIMLFPNPSNGELTIDGNGKKISTVVCRNALGQEFKHYEVNDYSFNTRMDVPSGLYLIQIETKDGVFIKKWVKD